MTGALWRIWLVARWEFITTVTRASFVAALVGLPVAHIALAAVLGVAIRSAIDDSGKRRPIAVVDTRGLLQGQPDGGDRIVPSLDAAMGDLRGKRVEAVFVLDEEYLASGRLRSYAMRLPGVLELGARVSQRERAARLIRDGLVTERDEGRVRRIAQPILAIDPYRVDGASVTPETTLGIIGTLAGPFGVSFVLALSIFLVSGSLQQVMSAELQNRMLEVILPLVPVSELLVGKVLGVSVVGLLQVALYLAILTGGAPMLLGGVALSASMAAWSAAVFMAGYVLFAVLLAATGAVSRDTNESTQVASVWMIVAACPFFFITHISAEPASAISAALTWFPPTAPVALLLRIGADGISTAQRIGAIAAILLAAAAALAAASAVFKARVVRGGR